MAAAKVIIITKKAKGHGHHGGAWKVAYADFVTAMMALFIMLWILSQTDKEVRQQLSEYFRTGVFSGAPSTMTGGSGLLDKGYLDSQTGDTKELELTSLTVTAQKVEKILRSQAQGNDELKKLLKDVSITVTPEGLLVQIVDTKGSMLFDRSSADLKPALHDLLNVLGPILARLGNKIQIHGHTDGKKFPAGSPKTNWSLSFDRGNEARRVLEPLLRPGQITGVYAHGDSMPASPDPLAPENRRLAILAVQHKKEPDAAAPTGVAPQALEPNAAADASSGAKAGSAPSASAAPAASAKPAAPAKSGTGSTPKP